MTKLYLDFESRSVLDLFERGLDNYVKDASTAPLMLSWAFDNDPVALWEPHVHGGLPKEVVRAIKSDVTLVAWNISFERNLFRHCLNTPTTVSRWLDIMVWARHLSLPGSLEDCGTAFGLAQDEAKIKDGDRLIKLFCEPFRAGGKESLFGVTGPEFHDWNSHPQDWEKFRQYCIRDTETERTLFKNMSRLPLPEIEQRGWMLDQKINETGMPTNVQFVDNAMNMAAKSKLEFKAFLKEATQLDNPNSRPQFLPWIQAQGYPHMSLGKNFVENAIEDLNCGLTDLGRNVLIARLQSSKTSDSKFEKIKDIVSADNQLRNQFAYMAASRTGRWASFGVQVQNLPRPSKKIKKKYDRAFELVSKGDYDTAKKEFPSIIELVVSVVRSSFQAPEGRLIAVADLNAIENRVIGWVANCDATLNVFREGRCPYLDFGADFNEVSYTELKAAYDRGEEDAEQTRTDSKPAVLGGGFGLGGGEMEVDKYGNPIRGGLWGYAKNMGVDITQEFAHKAVKVFRDKRPKIVQLWRELERAAVKAIKDGGEIPVGPVVFRRRTRKDGLKILQVQLPSGRSLHYLNPKTTKKMVEWKGGKPFESDEITYDGIGHGRGKQGEGWGSVKTYGGKLTENVVQGIARDVLLHAMLLADQQGGDIFYHAHDEVACLINEDDPFGFNVETLKEAMCVTPDWAKGLPLGAEGFTAKYYKKG